MDEKRYRIIYEDNWLIAVDKPSGMLVIPTPKKETNTLTDLLNRELDARGVEANAYPCHRIDRETSGVILYAKGKRMQQRVMEEFKNRRVKKTYTAFAHGSVKKGFDTIKIHIYNKNKRRNEIAITKYKVLSRRRNFTVVEVEPVTGRTNQIRVHFAKIGHPLLGEEIYAFRRDFDLRFRRVALHAKSLELVHPGTGVKVKFNSDLPKDMEEFLKNIA